MKMFQEILKKNEAYYEEKENLERLYLTVPTHPMPAQDIRNRMGHAYHGEEFILNTVPDDVDTFLSLLSSDRPRRLWVASTTYITTRDEEEDAEVLSMLFPCKLCVTVHLKSANPSRVRIFFYEDRAGEGVAFFDQLMNIPFGDTITSVCVSPSCFDETTECILSPESLQLYTRFPDSDRVFSNMEFSSSQQRAMAHGDSSKVTFSWCRFAEGGFPFLDEIRVVGMQGLAKFGSSEFKIEGERLLDDHYWPMFLYLLPISCSLHLRDIVPVTILLPVPNITSLQIMACEEQISTMLGCFDWAEARRINRGPRNIDIAIVREEHTDGPEVKAFLEHLDGNQYLKELQFYSVREDDTFAMLGRVLRANGGLRLLTLWTSDCTDADPQLPGWNFFLESLKQHPTLTHFSLWEGDEPCWHEDGLLNRLRRTRQIVDLVQGNPRIQYVSVHPEAYDHRMWDLYVEPLLSINRYRKRFEKLRKEGDPALIPYALSRLARTTNLPNQTLRWRLMGLERPAIIERAVLRTAEASRLPQDTAESDSPNARKKQRLH